jgi:HPt (histidine-containing phosphotransfer) domain-containing protein
MERAKVALQPPAVAAEPPRATASRSGGQRRAKAAAESPAILDPRAIDRLRSLGLPAGASGSDLVTELVDVFLKEVPDKLDRISKALAEEDYTRAHRFAHSLVSSAGNLGAVGLVKAARALESILRLKNQADSEQAYLALKREFDLLAPQLSRQRQKVD